LRQLLTDLEPYREASLAQVKAEHYKIERLLEMLVVAASDLLNHLLAERGLVADSYRQTFQLAAEEGMMPSLRYPIPVGNRLFASSFSQR
jgi:uncharacterized protein YutE (UPF0331/DUF86 family)